MDESLIVFPTTSSNDKNSTIESSANVISPKENIKNTTKPIVTKLKNFIVPSPFFRNR
jgi:hypothetical protein